MNNNKDRLTQATDEFQEAGRRLRRVWLSLIYSFCKGAQEGDFKHLLRKESDNIIELWQSFTSHREDLHRYLMHPAKARSAYLLSMHYPNCIRSLEIWQRTEQRTGIFQDLKKSSNPVHVWDIGCGTGALSQTFCQSLQLKGITTDRVSSWGVDQNRTFLEAYTQGMQSLAESITPLRIDIKRLKAPRVLRHRPYGVLILGNILNEIALQPTCIAKFQRWLINFQKAYPRHLILIAEPGEEACARQAQTWRNRLCSENDLTPLYPCTHSLECPMQEGGRDWCYSEISWQRPNEIRWVDDVLGINRQKLAVAGYVLCSQEWTADLDNRQYRPKAVGPTVVGRPTSKNDRSRFEYLLCDQKGIDRQPGRGSQPVLRGQQYSIKTAAEEASQKRSPRHQEPSRRSRQKIGISERIVREIEKRSRRPRKKTSSSPARKKS